MATIKVNGTIQAGNLNLGGTQVVNGRMTVNNQEVKLDEVVLGKLPLMKYRILLRTDGLADHEFVYVVDQEWFVTPPFEQAFNAANNRRAELDKQYKATVLKQWRIVSIKEID